jgi:dTDP-glucose pyrophosphorylase
MINIVIPAAGDGSRFKEAGYKEPKPLIPVCGKPMIERVLENLEPDCLYRSIVISRVLIPVAIPGRNIVLKEPTQGAVDTLLKAEIYVDDTGGLLIGNCDQLVDFDVNDFIQNSGYDGSLVVFKSSKDHHSYVRLDTDGEIEEIAEKQVISNLAVTGVYYFKYPATFFRCAKNVVANKDFQFRNEFYVSSVIDLMIKKGCRLNTFEASSAMLGTPEELQLFEMAVDVAENII